MSLQVEQFKDILNTYARDFKPTMKNCEVVSQLCLVFVRILQEEAEREQTEINQLRKLCNRRARKTIDNSVYIKLVERLFKQGWSNFDLGVSARSSSDTDISRESEVIA